MTPTTPNAERDDHALEIPEPGPAAAADWVDRHLSDVCGDDAAPSPRFRGGQRAAEEALAAFDVTGYATHRNAVWPEEARGSSGLSPWIRHGLLSLRRVWDAVEGGPPRDVKKFRSELLWQEYARHLYARVGVDSARSLRFDVAETGGSRFGARASTGMACVERTREELHRDGWIPNATRMWLASFWSVRGGGGWRDGEQRFFQHLLDGSRAANRLGWQWSSGAQTGRRYVVDRAKVERLAPDWCAGCAVRTACPLEAPLDASDPPRSNAPVRGLASVSPESTGAGPASAIGRGAPEAVWLTAESLALDEPALAAHPGLPALFVFDRARLRRWRLSRKRLVFLVETLAELALERRLELFVGDPVAILVGRPLAATHAPVPGWRTLAGRLEVVHESPWPWLVPPHAEAIASFSAWRKRIELPAARSEQTELDL